MATESINKRLELSRDLIHKKDLLEASRAISDSVKKSLDEKMSGLEAEVLIRLGKSLDNRVDKSIGDHLIKHLDSLNREFEQKTLALEKAYKLRAETMEEAFDSKVSFLKGAYEDALNKMTELVRSIHFPTPEVTITDAKIMLPEGAVVIKIPEELVKLSIPTPNVDIHVPPPRMTKKTHLYDDKNRPWQTIEEEIKE